MRTFPAELCDRFCNIKPKDRNQFRDVIKKLIELGGTKLSCDTIDFEIGMTRIYINHVGGFSNHFPKKGGGKKILQVTVEEILKIEN